MSLQSEHVQKRQLMTFPIWMSKANLVYYRTVLMAFHRAAYKYPGIGVGASKIFFDVDVSKNKLAS